MSALVTALPTRTSVLRGRSPAGPWELWKRVPSAELRGLAIEFWAGVTPAVDTRHTSLPNGEVAVMVHLGPALRLEREGDDRGLLRAGYIAGLQERPATYVSVAPATSVACVRLTPLGAYKLCGGLPQRELAQRVLDVDDVLGRRIESVRERMLDARSLGAAIDVLEDFVLREVRRARAAHPATRAALAMLASGTPVESVAQACGLSPRRLRELFASEIGVSAKRLARIVRFRRTLDRMAGVSWVELERTMPASETDHRRATGRPSPPEPPQLARLAQDSGYYDQPHMYREFQALAGLTPLQYLSLRGDALDGPDVISS